MRPYCEQVMLAKERAEKNREKRGDPVRVARRREPIRRRGTNTIAVIEKRGKGAVRLRRVCPPPSNSHDDPGNAALRGCPFLAAKLNQDASHNNKGRRRRRSVAVASISKEKDRDTPDKP
jgi:hypothetical protein